MAEAEFNPVEEGRRIAHEYLSKRGWTREWRRTISRQLYPEVQREEFEAKQRQCDQMEEEAFEIIQRIDDMGGMLAAIEKNYPQQEIADAAYHYQRQIDEKTRTVVGVNKYMTEEVLPVEILQIDEELERTQIEKTNRIKNDRNNKQIKKSLEVLGEACSGDQNVMEPIIDAVKAYATLQEVCDVFRKIFGEYRDPGIY